MTYDAIAHLRDLSATAAKAADTLGVHRNTLARKIKDLKIKV